MKTTIKKSFSLVGKSLSIALNLLFLPEVARQWLFGTGTRALEMLNMVMLVVWGIIALSNPRTMDLLPTYSKIHYINPEVMGALFIILALGQLAYMLKATTESNITSGFLLIVSAFIWSIIGIGYLNGYPPLTPGMVLYFPLAIINWWAGVLIIDNAKERLTQPKDA